MVTEVNNCFKFVILWNETDARFPFVFHERVYWIAAFKYETACKLLAWRYCERTNLSVSRNSWKRGGGYANIKKWHAPSEDWNIVQSKNTIKLSPRRIRLFLLQSSNFNDGREGYIINQRRSKVQMEIRRQQATSQV